MPTPKEQQRAAKKFSKAWKDKGYEIGESQKFWCDLLCNVFGVQDFSSYINFEIKIQLDHSSRADGQYVHRSRSYRKTKPWRICLGQ